MTPKAEEIVNQALADRAPGHRDESPLCGDHVAILMAICNGAPNLGDQLSSFLAQGHRNWSLIVSDDGSRDAGPDMVRDFARRSGHAVSMMRGPGRGFAANFLGLIRAAGPLVPYAAFSDQDDVWLPGKLSRALSRLSGLPADRPALYAARTVIADAGLRPVRLSPLFQLPPAFANALVQNIGGGNTMMLNRAALDLAQETLRHAGGVVAHDWWLYQIVSGAGGHVVYDPEPALLYRQHDGNLIGANDTAGAAFFRLAQLLQGRFRHWNDANIAALEASRHWLTPEARKSLTAFRRLRGGTPASRLRALRGLGLYRQTRRGALALHLAAMLDRV